MLSLKNSERMIDPQHSGPRQRYRWPWLLLAVLIVGIVLTVLWVLGAVRKVRQIRESTGQSALVTPSQGQASARPTPPGSTNRMVWIAGGTFLMGSDDGQPDERPVHEVYVDGFWIDQTEVTNEEFEKFIKATGYVTVAEQKPDAKLYPDVPGDKLVPGSIVFKAPAGEGSLGKHFFLWGDVPGAKLRPPGGARPNNTQPMKPPGMHGCWVHAMEDAE